MQTQTLDMDDDNDSKERRDQFDEYSVPDQEQDRPRDRFDDYTYAAEAEAKELEERNRRRRFLLGSICFLVVVAVAVLLGILLSRRSRGDPDPSTIGNDNNNNPTEGPTPAPRTTLPPTTVPPTTPPTTLGPTSLAPTLAPTTLPPTSAPTTATEGFIKNNTLGDGSEFDDPNSPQSQALAWIQLPSNLAQNWTEEQLLQRYALAVLQYSLGGRNWNPRGGWLTSLDMCVWSGLECNDRGLVETMELPGVGMDGVMPEEIIFLGGSLQSMALANNTNLRNEGDEEYEFFNGLPNLQYLGIQSTGMRHDGIPTQLGSLRQLRDLELQDSQWGHGGGPLPEEAFAGLNELSYLDLRGIPFEGTIPSSLLSLSSLRYIYMDGGILEGGLEWMSTMTAPVEEIWLDNCGVMGELPSSVPPTLYSLSITSNEFVTGPIPDGFCTNSKFQYLYFYSNDLNGTIPPCFANMTELSVFWFQFNGAMSGNVDFLCPLMASNGGNLLSMSNDVDVACACCSANMVVISEVPPEEEEEGSRSLLLRGASSYYYDQALEENESEADHMWHTMKLTRKEREAMGILFDE